MTTPIEVVTEKVLSAMQESQTLVWQKGWSFDQQSYLGRRYNGFNALVLSFLTRTYNYTSNVWVSQHALREAGGWVKKGEHFASVLYPVIKQVEVDGETVEKFCGMRYHNVCNLDQIANMGNLVVKVQTNNTQASPTLVSDLVTKHGIVIKSGQPSYSLLDDSIAMPPVSNFENETEYWATLAHELGHWTGKRLDRDMSNMSKAKYGLEELVAELFAVQLCGLAGIAPTIDNSAAYVQSWLRALQNDPAMLHKAAGLAQKAVEWVTNV